MTTLEKPSFTLPKAPGAIINGVVGRDDTAKGRFYIRPTDQLVLHSVTKIIDATSDMAYLKNWYAKLGGEVVIEQAPRISKMLAGDIEDRLRDAVNKKFKKQIDEMDAAKIESFIQRQAVQMFVAEEIRKRSEIKADIGSYQHWALEALVLDQPIPDFPDHLVGIEVDDERLDLDEISDGLLNFFTDFPNAIVLMAEATVANPALGTGGTLDLVIYIPGGITIDGVTYYILLIDLKTGKLYPEKMPMQLASYRYSTEVWLDSLGNIAPMPDVDGCAVLHLRKDYEDGYKLIIVEAGPKQFEQFAKRVSIYVDSENAPDSLGSIAYPPLPDGSQPLPMIEDIDVDGFGACKKILRGAGMRRIEDLASFSPTDITSLKGIKGKRLEACERALSTYGLHFAVKAGAA